MIYSSVSNFFAKIKDRYSRFIKSILFSPLLFAIAAVGLFLITSIIDESFPTGYSIDVKYIDALIFTGSPSAARSVLAAIAGAWATILGISFSVTLITLQLSVSKYISHLVNRFEGDRINQVALGWFIFTVLYSLLVLKTVRAGELYTTTTMMEQSVPTVSGETLFTPIIGVNMAIIISIIGLFMFILFLHNISSYLKPNLLISKLIDQIFNALKPYKKRTPSKSKYNLNSNRQIILEINSRQSGILSYIDWESISTSLTNFGTKKQKNVWMECSKSIGEWIEKSDTIVVIYEYNNLAHNEKREESESPKNHVKDNNDNNTYKNDNQLNNTTNNKNKNIDDHDNNTIDKDIEQKIIEGFDITPDRDLSRDPLFGIEILRSVAVKSAGLGDTDVIKSCITGIFRILHYAFMNKEIIGMPFTIIIEESKKKVKEITIEDNISSSKNSNNSKDKNQQQKQKLTVEAIINPKEVLLDNALLIELSQIIDKILYTRHFSIIHHIVSEYISLSKNLIAENKLDEFDLLTDWCASQISLVIKNCPRHLCITFIDLLLKFKTDIDQRQPHFANSFDIYMKDIGSIVKRNGN